MADDKRVIQEAIDSARIEAAEEFVIARQRFYDAAEAENSTQGWQRYFSWLNDFLPGAKVVDKKDQYGNMPTINVVIGAGITSTVQPTPMVEIVEPEKINSPFGASAAATWQDPLELLPEASPVDHAAGETLAALEACAGAMALPDD